MCPDGRQNYQALVLGASQKHGPFWPLLFRGVAGLSPAHTFRLPAAAAGAAGLDWLLVGFRLPWVGLGNNPLMEVV